MCYKQLIEKAKNGILTWDEWEDLRSELNLSIVRKNLPRNSNGFILCKGDKHIIFIREQLSEEKARETVVHELNHILNCDFDSEKTLEERENIK